MRKSLPEQALTSLLRSILTLGIAKQTKTQGNYEPVFAGGLTYHCVHLESGSLTDYWVQQVL